MQMLKTVTLATASALLLAACGTAPTLTTNNAPATTAASQENSGKPDPRTAATVTAPAVDALNDPNSILAKRSVYFDYDSYAVKQEFSPLVTAHANYLEGHKAAKIIIQGNTDERGGSEYNLALGQKRADAVRKALALLGVPDTRMEAVSFGKEKPKAVGSDEASWAENRRADLVYGK